MILQAGTGIAELIALEMSRRVSFCSYNIHVIFSDSYLFTGIWSNAIYHSNLSSIYFFIYMFLTFFFLLFSFPVKNSFGRDSQEDLADRFKGNTEAEFFMTLLNNL